MTTYNTFIQLHNLMLIHPDKLSAFVDDFTFHDLTSISNSYEHVTDVEIVTYESADLMLQFNKLLQSDLNEFIRGSLGSRVTIYDNIKCKYTTNGVTGPEHMLIREYINNRLDIMNHIKGVCSWATSMESITNILRVLEINEFSVYYCKDASP